MSRTHRILVSLSAIFCSIILMPPLVAAASEQPSLKLTILYMNDLHAHYLPYKIKEQPEPIGGFAKAQTVLEENRERSTTEGRETLTLMAGDLLMGTPFSTAFRGELGVVLMNAMKFDAMVVGNHEFDYGLSNLMENLKPRMKFPLLSANTKTADGRYLFERFITRDSKHGTRIVVFGLTTGSTPNMTLAQNVEGLVFSKPIGTARELLREFKDEDLVIALTHLGVTLDRKLAEACPAIDVIIGGHSHTIIQTPEKVGNTLICQAGAYAEYVGKLDLEAINGKVVDSRGELLFLGPDVKPDDKIASMIQEYRDRMEATYGEAIATSEIFLEGGRRSVRSDKQTNLGKLIAWLMARNVDAQVGLMNGGGIRASLPEGTITVGDVYTTLPFHDNVIKITMLGKHLQKVLQRSRDLEPGSGGKLHTSGITFTMQRGKVRILEVRGTPFQPDKEYTVAISNFLATGGDGYTIFRNKGKNIIDSGTVVSDLFIDFLRKHPVVTQKTIDEL